MSFLRPDFSRTRTQSWDYVLISEKLGQRKPVNWHALDTEF